MTSDSERKKRFTDAAPMAWRVDHDLDCLASEAFARFNALPPAVQEANWRAQAANFVCGNLRLSGIDITLDQARDAVEKLRDAQLRAELDAQLAESRAADRCLSCGVEIIALPGAGCEQMYMHDEPVEDAAAAPVPLHDVQVYREGSGPKIATWIGTPPPGWRPGLAAPDVHESRR